MREERADLRSPVLYVVGATTIVAVVVVYRPMTTWPEMVIVLLGLPV